MECRQAFVQIRLLCLTPHCRLLEMILFLKLMIISLLYSALSDHNEDNIVAAFGALLEPSLMARGFFEDHEQ